jgi:hypothetical protein
MSRPHPDKSPENYGVCVADALAIAAGDVSVPGPGGGDTTSVGEVDGVEPVTTPPGRAVVAAAGSPLVGAGDAETDDPVTWGDAEDAAELGGATLRAEPPPVCTIAMSPRAAMPPVGTVTTAASASVVAPPHQKCDGVGSPGG